MPSSGIALFILRGASDFYAPHHHSSLREQSFQTQSRDGTPHGNPEPDNLITSYQSLATSHYFINERNDPILSEIITAGNPILKAVAAPVTAFDKKLKFLILDMKKTLYEANGVGLAAPQIAVSKRIFVADDGESGFEAYINPVWQPDGDEMATDSEGCLSVPGLFGEVTRYARVIVRYQDIHGKKKVKKASGLLARCIQHETDHLNGILFIEKAISLHKGPKDEE